MNTNPPELHTFILVLPFEAGNHFAEVWKPVRLQCLPPIGTTFYLHVEDGEIGGHEVVGIRWFEHIGGYYEIALSVCEMDDNYESALAWLKENGWREGDWF